MQPLKRACVLNTRIDTILFFKKVKDLLRQARVHPDPERVVHRNVGIHLATTDSGVAANHVGLPG